MRAAANPAGRHARAAASAPAEPGSHRASRRARSAGRVRALLALGTAGAMFAIGSFAFWTDDVVISGTTFTAGTLDLKVNAADSVTTGTLSMTSTPMAPGDTSAEAFTLSNAGTIPLKYTVSGGLAGTDGAAFATASALLVTISSGATVSGSGNAATCAGGTVLVGPTALTTTLSTALIGTRRGPLAVSGTEVLCFQISFDAAAPSSLQGNTATATFTVTGTSDVS